MIFELIINLLVIMTLISYRRINLTKKFKLLGDILIYNLYFNKIVIVKNMETMKYIF